MHALLRILETSFIRRDNLRENTRENTRTQSLRMRARVLHKSRYLSNLTWRNITCSVLFTCVRQGWYNFTLNALRMRRSKRSLLRVFAWFQWISGWHCLFSALLLWIQLARRSNCLANVCMYVFTYMCMYECIYIHTLSICSPAPYRHKPRPQSEV